jgi:hypothetical protein
MWNVGNSTGSTEPVGSKVRFGRRRWTHNNNNCTPSPSPSLCLPGIQSGHGGLCSLYGGSLYSICRWYCNAPNLRATAMALRMSGPSWIAHTGLSSTAYSGSSITEERFGEAWRGHGQGMA